MCDVHFLGGRKSKFYFYLLFFGASFLPVWLYQELNNPSTGKKKQTCFADLPVSKQSASPPERNFQPMWSCFQWRGLLGTPCALWQGWDQRVGETAAEFKEIT